MKNMTNIKKNERGFSLVEVMVSIFIFAIASFGLVALQKVSMDASTMGRERTSAANIASYGVSWLQNEAGAYADAQAVTNYPNISKGINNPGKWLVLSNSNTFRFNEYYNNDQVGLSASGVDVHNIYCVEYMLNQYASTNDPSGFVDNLYNITVRVTWPKKGRLPSDWDDCSQRAALITPSAPAASPYNQVLVSRVITRDFANKIEL